MSPQIIVGLILKSSIMLTVFSFGLEATKDDLLYVLRRPGLLVRSLVSLFVIMPLFALLLTSVFHFQLPVMIALIALSITPVPPALPRKVGKAGGVTSYGLGLMVTAASLSILIVPVAAHLLGKYFNKPFDMDPLDVAKLIGLTVLLPIALGILFQRILPAFAASIQKYVGLAAKILLLIALVAVLIFVFPKSLSLIGNGTVMAIIAFILVGLVAGHLLGGPDSESRVTLSLATACRHPGLALALAAANMPNEHNVLSAVLLYLVLNALITGLYLYWRGRRNKNQSVIAAS
jgi:BASS family bile acid:Na+ symporter